MNILKCVILSATKWSRKISTYALCAILLALFACTDYEAQIDDEYEEWIAEQEEDESSSLNVDESSSLNVEIGSMTDSRDGQTYKTVTIGLQTWMAENLNYETGISYCYGNNETYCTEYGRLYTWATAITACPGGWHLPSEAEWNTLITTVGGSSVAGGKLKTTSGWYNNGNGSDDFGFSARPAGVRYNNGNYGSNDACFWSSTEYYGESAYKMCLYYSDNFALQDSGHKGSGFPIRCLKD